jgi:hypothetical protein
MICLEPFRSTAEDALGREFPFSLHSRSIPEIVTLLDLRLLNRSAMNHHHADPFRLRSLAMISKSSEHALP